MLGLEYHPLRVLTVLAWSVLPALGVWAVAYAVTKALERRKRNEKPVLLAIYVLMITSKGVEPITWQGILIWLGGLALLWGGFALFLWMMMRLVKRLPISKGDMANIVVFLVGLGFYYSNIPIIRNMGGWLLGASVIIYIIRVMRKGKAEGKEVFIF